MVLDLYGKKEPSSGDLFSLNVAKFIDKALDPHFTAL